jgi:long-chain acyl-CoA synthetase
MNLAAWLARSGRSHGELPAVAEGSRSFQTYGDLAERAARLAGGLREGLGLVPGDRVALAAYNCPQYLEALYGIWHGGLAAVPANAKLHGAELGHILENSGARVCFADQALEAAIAEHRPDTLEHLVTIGGRDYQRLFAGEPAPLATVAPDDLAWLFYTSGTTGRPKGAMLTHRNLLTMSFAYLSDVDVVGPGDAILHAAPLSHGSGLYAPAHIGRAAVNVVPESGGFDPDEVFRMIEAWPGTSLFAAPTMVKRLVDHPGEVDFAKIRTLIYGGGPMYVEQARAALERFGPRLAQIYGQGESPMTITVLSRGEIANKDHPRWLDRLGSVGVANSAVEVRVADEDDRALPTGQVGEIQVRGDTVMAGYWRNDRASAETLRGGWLHTGDLGVFDDDGFLTLKDRSKDVIISGGANIYPREVEELLLAHPGVLEASVIGRADPDWGEVVVAYLVGEAEPEALDRHCLQHIARFKRPKAYVKVDALPKNNYGKVLKTELRVRDAAALAKTSV